MGFKHAVAGANPAFASGCAYNIMRTSWGTAPLPQIMTIAGTCELCCAFTHFFFIEGSPLWLIGMVYADVEPYLRYVEEVNWVDVVKMMRIIGRYTTLLMDQPVEETEDEFFDYVKADTRPMILAQLHVTKMHYLYTMGRYGEAVVEGRKAAEILTYITQFKEEVGTCDSTIGMDCTHCTSTDCAACRVCHVSCCAQPRRVLFLLFAGAVG
jgi:hypothetical protein